MSKRKIIIIISILIVGIGTAIGIYCLAKPQEENNRVVSTILMDINPSFKM